ncbi:MHC class I antigen [Labeo rohita]|uniref:MHC class I antigen n=1 Tax=Labeo rohita TaxID=84645 RepID=A0A498LG00_LABRO|nr:MHC class I antigen [Labeo rohita]
MLFIAEKHSLYYIYTVLSKPVVLPSIYQFTAMGLLDDIQIDYYNSNEQKKIPKQTWIKEKMQEDYWEKGTQSRKSKEQWFNVNIDILMKRMRHTESDLHVLQWRTGCEIEKQGDEVKFSKGISEYAYDGADFLSFDDKESLWVAPVAEALPTKIKWDNVPILNQYTKGYLEKECVDWLNKFREYLDEKLRNGTPPDVHVFAKRRTSDKTKLKLTCMATGFYPRDLMMTIREYRTSLPKYEVKSTGIRPNHDGTFQLTKSVEINKAEVAEYDCFVTHRSIEEPVIIKWGQQKKTTESLPACVAYTEEPVLEKGSTGSFDIEVSQWVAPVDAALTTKRKWDNVPILNQYTRGYLEKECVDWLKKFREYGDKEIRKACSFDIEVSQWVAPVDAALTTKRKWDNVPILNQYTRGYLEKECVDWLKKFREYGDKEIRKASSPDVHVFARKSSDETKLKLTCMATGFYAKDVMMTIRKYCTSLPEDEVESTGIRPNHDGTFQLKKSVEIQKDEIAEYDCFVSHRTFKSITLKLGQATKSLNAETPAGMFLLFDSKFQADSNHINHISPAGCERADVSIDELGVYYCTNIDRTAQFSNGTRLDQTTSITVPTPVSECLCQNHTVVEQSTDPTLWKTASVVFSLINVCLVFGFIGFITRFHLKSSVSQDCIMLKILQLQLYLLAYCQVEEILTYQLTDLGQNVTINCSLDIKEVTWLLLNSPDPPVLILRSFSNPPHTFYFNIGFKEKYSVQSKHNLFIKNVSIDELGVYYCTNIDRTAQFSNGTRLDQTTSITVPTPVSECLCQNHTVVEQSTDPTLWQTATVVFSLINVCLVFGFIDVSIDELGVYYCMNIDRTAQFRNGTRLDQTTPITVPTPVCQNHTVVEQSTDPTLWKTATVVFSLINVFLVSGFIVFLGICFADHRKKHPQQRR